MHDSRVSEDELYAKTVPAVTLFGSASPLLLQLMFDIGYARACRLMDRLEENGIIGPQVASIEAPRSVIKSRVQATDTMLRGASDYERAVDLSVRIGIVSPALLQRRFKIGYKKAVTLLDRMEREGVIGPADGAIPRKVTLNRNF